MIECMYVCMYVYVCDVCSVVCVVTYVCAMCSCGSGCNARLGVGGVV